MTLQQEMKELISRELMLHGIHLDETSWLSSEAVLNELTHVLTPEPHEGKTPAFGVIFTDSVHSLKAVRKLAVEPAQVELARKLADGVNSFLLYEKAVPSGLVFFPEPITTEIQLVRTVPQTGGMVVQRSSKGITKFVRNQGIVSHYNRNWFSKPHIQKAASRIIHCIPDINRQVLNGILEFSFHLLSPASRMGAILVWHLNSAQMNDYSSSFSGPSIQKMNLSILNEQDAKSICHLLSQVDGATILSPDGTFLQTGVQLKPSLDAVKLIPEYKGTRHSSALRFSYDRPNVLIFTVSEDGPVTIFSDGNRIADLKTQSAEQETQLLMSLVPEEKENITSRSLEITCERCGKQSLIEEIMTRSYESPQTATCAVCGNLLYSSRCFKLHCSPFKRIADLDKKAKSLNYA